MGYRGDDLDLRTPQAAPAEAAAAAPGSPFTATRTRSVGAANGAPIWVDETVLDICNHAFDVASAHRAVEVRLEHLVYALTRTDDAADALEDRGLRVSPLRREAAGVIATEIPAAQGSGKTTPRRAEAFEELLRIAAAHAYRRQSPVGVADIVYALFDAGADFTSLLRLLPSAHRAAPAHGELAFLDVDAVRERIRNGPAPAQTSRGLASDLASLSAAQVSNQHSRIDAIEQSIRALTTELANERKILSGVLQDLQRELMAQREDTSRLGGITQEKIQAIFGDRLQSLEQAFLSRAPAAGDLGGLHERLSLVESSLQAEIATTRAAVDALSEKLPQDLSPLTQRLDTLEASSASDRERAKSGEEALSSRIQSLSETLDGQPAHISSLVSNPLVDQLNAMTAARDAQHASAAEAASETNRRLAQLEEAFAAHVARAEAAAETAAQERVAIRALLERLNETIAQEAENSREAFNALTENLTQDLSELHDGLTKVDGSQLTLAATLDAQGLEASTAASTLLARIENLERASAKPVEMLTALSTTVEKMHKVTIEKYYRRNRFWYWLFGTDDWLAASWPSQSERIAEELKSLKS